MTVLLGKTLPPNQPHQRQEGARFALLALSALNLLNYADRYVPSAVKPLFKEELGLTAMETALPASAMVIVYMSCAPLFGLLGDANYVDRRKLLAAAVVLWSLATGLAARAENLWQLVLFRSLVGVGEAAYTTLCGPFVADFYPPNERNMAFTIFGLSAPLGGALGYCIGALVGSVYGWRAAFWACGVPGIVAAIAVLMCNDPPRGINDIPVELLKLGNLDSLDISNLQPQETNNGERQSKICQLFRDVWTILSDPRWALATAGLVANSFALGGFADWSASFLYSYQELSMGLAGTMVSGATLIGGLVGILLGAKAADAGLSRFTGNSYFLVPAACTLPGAVFLLSVLNLPKGQDILVGLCLVLGLISFFTFVAPISTVSINTIPKQLRSKSSGLQILMTHVLGDVISPPIVGAMTDATGSLRASMQILWVAVLLSGLFWSLGYFFTRPFETEGKVDGSIRSLLCQESQGFESIGSSEDQSESSNE